VTGLSVLLRGSPDDKLRWTFSLYDANGDGLVSKADMMEVVSAIYALMGRFAEPCIRDDTAKQHVDRVFEVYTTVYDRYLLSYILLLEDLGVSASVGRAFG